MDKNEFDQHGTPEPENAKISPEFDAALDCFGDALDLVLPSFENF